MGFSAALLSVLTCFLAMGCEKVVYRSNGTDSATARRNALVDSAFYYVDVRERPDSALHILEQLKPLCEPSPELRARYNAILLELAWKTGNYEDVLTASIPSLYQAMVRGQRYDEGNAQLSNIVGHALRKSGDTAGAIRYYQYMASHELLTTRKDALANLLRLYSRTGNHEKAIEIAVQIEPQELMHSSDISAHLNREFYWGRSLLLSGRNELSMQHFKKVLVYLAAPRSNYNATELRVRLSTTRGMLSDDVIKLLPSAIRRPLEVALNKSASSDSSYLQTRFKTSEHHAGLQRIRIPSKLFLPSPTADRMFLASTVDTTVINQTVYDAYGVRWHATLLGLFIEVGQHVVRVELPSQHGIARPVKSIHIQNDTLYMASYSGRRTQIPIDNVVSNYTRCKPRPDFYSVTPSKTYRGPADHVDTLRLNDTTFVVGDSCGLTLHTHRNPNKTTFPNPNGIHDILLTLYRSGDSIIFGSRALGMRVIEEQKLMAGRSTFQPFEPLKALRHMSLPSSVAAVAERQILGEYPPQSIALYDGIYPTTVQRIYVIGRKHIVIVRANSIMTASTTNNELQLFEWPDSLVASFEQGFHTRLRNDSLLEIRSSKECVTVNITRILARPLPSCLIAWTGPQNTLARLAWLSKRAEPIPCSESLTFVVGTSSLLSNYLTTISAEASWRPDTILYSISSIYDVPLPYTRECSLKLYSPGLIQTSSLVLQPNIHPLLYQHVVVMLVVLGSGLGAVGIVYIWHRNAIRRRQDLDHQHSSIARDLHDTLGADLARLTALLNAHDIRDSREIVNAALTANRKFRSLLWIWRSDSIRLSDFTGELREYLHASLSDAHIELTASTTELPENSFVDATVAKNVLLIINEALSNIIRHASSTNVTVDFISNQASFTVKVIDNGIGFDPNNLHRKSGIRHIQERASENGFHADVISAEGMGTTVLVSFGVQLS